MSPIFIGSPTKVAISTPLGKAGLVFHIRLSGISRVSVSCAMTSIEKAIKLVAAKRSFFMRVLPNLMSAQQIVGRSDETKSERARVLSASLVLGLVYRQ